MTIARKTPLTCPGCGGKISRGATLCRECRKRAIVAGVNLLAPGAREVYSNTPPPPAAKRTSGQNRAFWGKVNRLAKLTARSEEAVHDWALEQASEMLGRHIVSSKDLTEDEMSDTIDLLRNAIVATEAAA